MNVPLNLAKSSMLALIIFWTIICSKEGFDTDLVLLILLSFIPIFLVVAIVILGSICPIYWITKKEDYNNLQIFKTYYPYYAIIAFICCLIGIIINDLDIYFVAFFVSAFITSNQSWVWFANEEQSKT
ncbi:hypothetical protein [Psychroserpens ponticola]|uniref:Uncharacterized protein n=1 Tax=Psychroserpens ponticola TaxID=2932268 RepID=A0ABY7RUP2_9FLAO|nr:hypothetical protein [Psychroserpens ponticola]WCO00854.1 hypothetical protein MUN68_012345 [Psychroserpens ponticola]